MRKLLLFLLFTAFLTSIQAQRIQIDKQLQKADTINYMLLTDTLGEQYYIHKDSVDIGTDNQICSAYISNDTLNIILCNENAEAIHIMRVPITHTIDTYVEIDDTDSSIIFIRVDDDLNIYDTIEILFPVEIITQLFQDTRGNWNYVNEASDTTDISYAFELRNDTTLYLTSNGLDISSVTLQKSVQWSDIVGLPSLTQNGGDIIGSIDLSTNEFSLVDTSKFDYELTQTIGCVDSAFINILDVTTVQFTTRITIKPAGDVIYYAIIYDGVNVDLRPYNIYYRKDGVIVADETKQEFFDAFFIEFGVTLPEVDLWSFSVDYENIFIPFPSGGNQTALVSGLSTSSPSFALSIPGSTLGTFNPFAHLQLPLSITLTNKSVDVFNYWDLDTTLISSQIFYQGIKLANSSYVPGACDKGSFYSSNDTIYHVSSTGNVEFVIIPSSSDTVATEILTFDFKVFLEGPYIDSSSEMTTNIISILPPVSPYGSILPYYNTNHKLATDFSNVVDWVLVKFRTISLDPVSTVLVIPGLLLADGSIRFETLDNVVLGLDLNIPYSIVIQHRNHARVESHILVSFTGTTLTHDFTIQASKQGEAAPGIPFGITSKQMPDGNWAMYAGDIVKEVAVAIVSDENGVINSQLNSSGYLSADLNLDGLVDITDQNFWLLNSGQRGFIKI